MFISYWQTFQDNFYDIIKEHPYFNNIFDFIVKYNYNILLYGINGFPIDLFIDEILKKKFNIINLNKKECKGFKDTIYYHHQNFLEFDLLHPSMPKKLDILCKFLISIIKNKNISYNKHLIIIKNINVLNKTDFSSFRIILEKYQANVYFICTTLKLNQIDIPVKSRFSLIRIPLFEHSYIKYIFKKYLNTDLNIHLCEIESRDIIKALFLAEIELTNKTILTKEFCILNYPPLKDFIDNLDKRKNNLENIKQISLKCFQYNISIPNLITDLLLLMPNKSKDNIIKNSVYIEHLASMTNKCRESIYIETVLCNILL